MNCQVVPLFKENVIVGELRIFANKVEVQYDDPNQDVGARQISCSEVHPEEILQMISKLMLWTCEHIHINPQNSMVSTTFAQQVKPVYLRFELENLKSALNSLVLIR